MKIGLHVSAAGDLTMAPTEAVKYQAECFQFFSRSPQGGPAKPTAPIEKKFISLCQKNKLTAYIHAPYYINFGSKEKRVFHSSIGVISEELKRANALGVYGLMTHLGSAKDLGDQAIKQVIDGLVEVLKNYRGATVFMIENSAGSGAIIGDTFEEIAEIISGVERKLRRRNLIGVCLDTAHAFASGYDLRTPATVKKTFKEFDKIIGLKRLKVIHANDSLADFNSNKDRHAHIGKGKIGVAGFKAIVTLVKKHKIDLVLETHHDGQEINDLKVLKRLRGQ